MSLSCMLAQSTRESIQERGKVLIFVSSVSERAQEGGKVSVSCILAQSVRECRK